MFLVSIQEAVAAAVAVSALLIAAHFIGGSFGGVNRI